LIECSRELLSDGVDLEAIYMCLAAPAIARQFDHEMEIMGQHIDARYRHAARRREVQSVFARRKAERLRLVEAA
jgi:hypothetical protein